MLCSSDCLPLHSVRLDFVYDLFEHVLSRNKQDTLKSSSKHRRPTVSSQFKVRRRPPHMHGTAGGAVRELHRKTIRVSQQQERQRRWSEKFNSNVSL